GAEPLGEREELATGQILLAELHRGEAGVEGERDRGEEVPSARRPAVGHQHEPRHGHGRKATIRSGAPVPPPIFIGSATTAAPASGRRSRCATFSNPGTFAAPTARCTGKSEIGR